MTSILNKYLLSFILFLVAALHLQAQTCTPTATYSYTDSEGQPAEESGSSFTGSAPVTGRFTANPSDYEGYVGSYTWHVYTSDKSWNDYLITRSGEDFEYTFTQSGTFIIELRATFTDANGLTVDYPEEGTTPSTFTVTVSESKLEMPNAFSPNGDGHNDIYRAKQSTLQSIVEFKATIFNRWGQKLYQWTDPHGGWDGKYNGKTVKDGVYFVNVVAKGADGTEYKIRKDVNVLTRYTENEGETDN